MIIFCRDIGANIIIFILITGMAKHFSFKINLNQKSEEKK